MAWRTKPGDESKITFQYLADCERPRFSGKALNHWELKWAEYRVAYVGEAEARRFCKEFEIPFPETEGVEGEER